MMPTSHLKVKTVFAINLFFKIIQFLRLFVKQSSVPREIGKMYKLSTDSP